MRTPGAISRSCRPARRWRCARPSGLLSSSQCDQVEGTALPHPKGEGLEVLRHGAARAVGKRLTQAPIDCTQIHTRRLKLLGECDATYPLQKKFHTPEFVRELLHLRPRSRKMGAMLRIRDSATSALNDYLRVRRAHVGSIFLTHARAHAQSQEFLQVHCPALTPLDCEGAGELFRVTVPGLEPKKEEFFGVPMYLSVSGQLYAEMAACALS
jgi:aspartyl/asparaginyl-tRNA synthetase